MTELSQAGGAGTAGDLERRDQAMASVSGLSWALRALEHAQEEVGRALARQLGLRQTEFTAMEHLWTAAEPLGPAELSSRLGISTGSGTELADRLERVGHLERRPHPQDRRRVSLHPTEQALGRIMTELGPLLAALDNLAGELSDDERAVVLGYLSRATELLHEFAAERG